MARPGKIFRTAADKKELKAKIISLMERDETLGYADACNQLKVPFSTVTNWRNLDKEFHDKINSMIEDTKWITLDRADKNIMQKIKEGDLKASIFYVRHRPESKARGWDFSATHVSKEDDLQETAEKIALMVNMVNKKMQDDKS